MYPIFYLLEGTIVESSVRFRSMMVELLRLLHFLTSAIIPSTWEPATLVIVLGLQFLGERQREREREMYTTTSIHIYI